MRSVNASENPLLSVIVPDYNTDEELLYRCLDSIKNQTYKNIEVILVDDGSNFPISIDSDKYCNLKIITHETNRGLYRARISGFKASQGEYISTLDSDDYVSPDFYRSMIHRAQEEDFDVVAGRTVFEDAQGAMTVRNLHEACFGDSDLHGDDVRKAYYGQQGSCFVWHTVWNKVYSRRLWEKCIGYLDSIREKVVMTEDVLFSSVLFYNAKSFSYVPNEGIHYCENESSSTANKNAGLDRFERNIASMKTVFEAVDRYLELQNADESIKNDFLEFRKLYSRMWRSYQQTHFTLPSASGESRAVIDGLLPGYSELSSESDHYFEIPRTPYNPDIENIKAAIINPTILVVSFDMFDTLVTRPFMRPEDLFCLMDVKAKQLGCIRFSYLRHLAEEDLRSKWWKMHPGSEDFSLSDIYDHLVVGYGVDRRNATRLKNLEIKLEKRFCTPRRSAKDLFDLAVYLGKRIVVTSDMYLEKETAEGILRNCGYLGYEKLFISSKEGRTKYTGNLFKEVISYLKVKPSSILHIGDDWQKDVKKPTEYRMNSRFLPKAIESYKGIIQDVKTNGLGHMASLVVEPFVDPKHLENSLGYRTIVKLSANLIFDNPCPSFNRHSDFNCSAEVIGYSVVGPHLLGICKWLYDSAEASEVKRIAFLSRDGYVPKKAFDTYVEGRRKIRTNYVCCSRRCLMPWMVSSPIDLLDLPIEVRNHSQRSIIELLDFCMDVDDEARPNLKKEKFCDFKSYAEFIRGFSEDHFSDSKLKTAKKVAREYYRARISRESMVFDMGYSGRIAFALKMALGYGIHYMYVYKTENSSEYYENRYSLKISTLYQSTPEISGFFREYILSEQGRNCVGFVRAGDGNIEPVLEEGKSRKLETYAADAIQRSALRFVKEYVAVFKEYDEPFLFNPYKVSLGFESMLIRIRDFDRYLFKNSFEDDTTYGGTNTVSVYALWEDFLSRYYKERPTPKAIVDPQIEKSEWAITPPQKPFQSDILNRAFFFSIRIYREMRFKFGI